MVTQKQQKKFNTLTRQIKTWKSKMENLDKRSAALEKQYEAYKKINDTARMRTIANRMLQISKEYEKLGR